MEIYLSQIAGYLLNVLHSTFNQLFMLFGPLLVLVVLLNYSATLVARLSIRFLGQKLYLYGFGWFGCSVHELSHAFFALIFGHKIKEIALFKPNSGGESLGHVSHSYNKNNIYQKIGNFFIGIGPLLAGGIVLFVTTLALYRVNITDLFSFRISPQVFTERLLINEFFAVLWSGLLSYSALLFTGKALFWWKSALLICILYSTGSSMTLSKSDVKGAFSGFLWFVIFMLVVNLLTLWSGDFVSRYLALGVQYISAFYFLLILSFGANLFLILLFFVLNLLKKVFVKG